MPKSNDVLPSGNNGVAVAKSVSVERLTVIEQEGPAMCGAFYFGESESQVRICS
jgi:hypothetical protein